MWKNLVIAILITILISLSFGQVMLDWFDINIMVDDLNLTSAQSLIAITGVCIMAVIIGFIVAISVAGALIIGAAAVLFGLIVAGVAAFWPAILVVMILVWLVKDKSVKTYS